MEVKIISMTASKGHRCPWCWRKASWKPTWRLIRVECFHNAQHIRVHWRLCGASIAASRHSGGNSRHFHHQNTSEMPILTSRLPWDGAKIYLFEANWRWAVRTRRVSDVTLIVRAFRTSRGRRSSCRHVDDMSTLFSQRSTPLGRG